MTPDQAKNLKECAEMGAQIAQLYTVPGGRPVALAMLAELTGLMAERFPRSAPLLRAVASGEKPGETDMSTKGPKLWAELHGRARQPVADVVVETLWLAAFAKKLTCGECRNFYNQYLDQNRPQFEAYFEWTVDLHNAVNRKLGKPVMEPAAARVLFAAKA